MKTPEWFLDEFDGCTVEEMKRGIQARYDKGMEEVNKIIKSGVNPCYDGEDETLTKN